jgi:hypothetical protein
LLTYVYSFNRFKAMWKAMITAPAINFVKKEFKHTEAYCTQKHLKAEISLP